MWSRWRSAAWLARRWLRARRAAAAVLAAVVAAGTAASLVALEAAQRSATAYGSHLERGEVGDLVINPALPTTDIDAVIRGLPGVAAVTADSFFSAAIDEGAPRTYAAGLTEFTDHLVRGSRDGRYLTMDRPALSAGRLPTGRAEALVSGELADRRDLSVGDTIPVAFWHSQLSLAPSGPQDDEVVHPLGVERLTIVGIGTFADEVLPEGLFARGRVVVSADVAARYDCLPELPPAAATVEEAVAALVPAGCAMNYPYYSLRSPGGPRAVAAAQDAFRTAATELNARLPTAVTELGGQYAFISTTTAEERRRVERSVAPAVAALGVLGLLALATTVAVASLALARDLRRSAADFRQWWQAGLPAGERLAVAATPAAIAVALGLAVGVAAAWWFSAAGPVGTVRSVDPSPGRSLATWSWLALGALTVALSAGSAVLAWLSVRRPQAASAGAAARSRLVALAFASGRPALIEGVRAGVGGRGARLVMGSGAVAATTVVLALSFGANLSSLVSTPAKYGWPWDVASIGGYGYGGLDLTRIGSSLEAHPSVTGWTGLGMDTGVSIDGDPVMALVALNGTPGRRLTVAEGRLPSGPDEVALGQRTARDSGLAVGDRVELSGGLIDAPRSMEVSGLVVLPALGPYQADRAGPGSGVLLPAEALDPAQVERLISFVGVSAAAGTDPDALLADLAGDLAEADTNGFTPFTYPRPVRPPEIVDAERMQLIPGLVGATMVVAASTGLVVAVGMSVRARRRELAILRALGFTARQVRLSVQAQAATAMAGALTLGIFAGLVASRVLWRAFSEQLGVVPDLVGPWASVGLAVAGGLAVAALAALLPARAAARSTTARWLVRE